MKSTVMDGDKAKICSVHEVSMVEQAAEKDVNHIDETDFQKMESMMENVQEILQKMSEYINLRLDFVHKDLKENLKLWPLIS